MAAAAILFSIDSSQKLIRSSEIPGEQPYQIWMQSKQRFISYRAHKLFRRPFFSNGCGSHFILMDSCQKLIRSSEIPREQPYQTWMQSKQRFLSYRAHKLFRRPFFLNGCRSHFVFNWFIPKVNQIIRNTWRTTIPNLNAIQATVHKLSCPQAFYAAIFLKMAAAAILFLMDSSQKIIRSSEIPREQPYQIWMQSKQRFISYRAHKLFRRAFFLNGCGSHFVFNGFISKANQIIKNT